MIMDNLKNADKYEKLNNHFQKAFQFLMNTNLEELSAGRHEIDGDNVFANVQEYETNPIEQTGWESHAKYIDIQFVVKGKEKIGWCDIDKLTIKEDRSKTSDAIFYENNLNPFSESLLAEGDYCIYFPSDAHRPCICHNEVQPVKKIVVKVIAQ